MTKFRIESKFQPMGSQPQAIDRIVKSIESGNRNQVLLGVTGSGKTFTMANVIQKLQRPTIIMVHNKTLAAQIYGEMREFFPENAVGYFVSYYDYYQPEAYIAKTDTYIAKDSVVNDQIDMLRHYATQSLLQRRDAIIIASVSAIYGIGSPELYSQMAVNLEVGYKISNEDLLLELDRLQYKKTEDLIRGSYSVNGNFIDICPPQMDDVIWRVKISDGEIKEFLQLYQKDRRVISVLNKLVIYPASHYATPMSSIKRAIVTIKEELLERVEELKEQGKFSEADRLVNRTNFDIEMMTEFGFCKGIENYSRHIDGRLSGLAGTTLFDYLPDDGLLIADESHVTIPQIRGMYHGDLVRKNNLIENGFRLPSARDNRPMRFEEWDVRRPTTLFVSATPGRFEMDLVQNNPVEQIIRPTGLLDPECFVRPSTNQIDDLIGEINLTKKSGAITLITTITKKMAEDLHNYLTDLGIRSNYIHSDVKTLDRIKILQDLRRGSYDVLIGVNLLREGLDIPECGLLAVLDADKEGFLRNTTSLIQMIGRAARNQNGRVILYANRITKSIRQSLDETERRRKIQIEYNQQNGIIPKTVNKGISTMLDELYAMQMKGKKSKKHDKADSNMIGAKNINNMNKKELEILIARIEADMLESAANLEFEKAANLRDKLSEVKDVYIDLVSDYKVA